MFFSVIVIRILASKKVKEEKWTGRGRVFFFVFFVRACPVVYLVPLQLDFYFSQGTPSLMRAQRVRVSEKV